MESSQDFDGTREFAEESLNEEIKEELIDTVFDITGSEVDSSEVLQKLEELNDEEKALEQIDNIDDYEKEYIGEELKNKLFEDLIDSSTAPVSESGEIGRYILPTWFQMEKKYNNKNVCFEFKSLKLFFKVNVYIKT